VAYDKVNSYNIGFMLAPRLNAAGRLESALKSLALLLETDLKTAGELAQELDAQNVERQKITREYLKIAIEMTSDGKEPYFIFVVHEEFNQGVVGLVASRLVEKFYRPAIVGQKMEKYTKGSGRSITEFHITEALDECSDLLVKHGGHSMAAGFTVENEKLDILKERLQSIAKRQLGEKIEQKDLQPMLRADCIAELKDLKGELLKYLDDFQPTGMGNPEPLFLTKGVKIKEFKQIGKEGDHLKMKVTKDDRLVFDAIGFRMGGLAG